MAGLQNPLFLVFISLSIFTVITQPAFAEQHDLIKDVITGTIEDVYTEITDPIEIPADNLLNTTAEEFQSIKDEGYDVIKALINLFGETHDLSESTVRAVSPVELDEFMVALIGIGVVAVIALPIMKKVGLDMMKIVIIGVIIVVIFLMLPILME